MIQRWSALAVAFGCRTGGINGRYHAPMVVRSGGFKVECRLNGKRVGNSEAEQCKRGLCRVPIPD